MGNHRHGGRAHARRAGSGQGRRREERRQPAQGGEGLLKVATWNVNGIRARATQLCQWLERDRPDVVCLQELKAEAVQIPEACKLPDYHAYWHCMRAYSGVSLHVRSELCANAPVFSHPDFDMESRIVQAQLGDTVLASVYVPNGGKDYAAKLAFMERLIEWVRRLHAEGRSLILCGDINIARTEVDVHPVERKPHIIGQRPEERTLFERLLGEHLVDVGRARDPDNQRLFTWWPPWRNMRARNMGWRLDYVLASRRIADKAESCKVLADVGTSDHAPVMMVSAYELGGRSAEVVPAQAGTHVEVGRSAQADLFARDSSPETP